MKGDYIEKLTKCVLNAETRRADRRKRLKYNSGLQIEENRSVYEF